MSLHPRPPHGEAAARERSSIPDGVWVKCPGCKEILFARELQRNGKVCPHCQYHYSLTGAERIRFLLDEGSFHALDGASCVPQGVGRLDGVPVAIGVVDSPCAETMTTASLLNGLRPLVQRATEDGLPLLLVCAAGSAFATTDDATVARARFHLALRRLSESARPYLLVLTDPTPKWGYAAAPPVGDVVIAEAPPEAAAFAPQSPDAAHVPPPFVDLSVPRSELQQTVSRLLTFFSTPGDADGERPAR